MANEREGPLGAGPGGVEEFGDGADIVREIALIFEQLEVSVRAAKERAAGLALGYRGLDSLTLSARLVNLAEAVGQVQSAASLTIHHLRNCASEVLLVNGR